MSHSTTGTSSFLLSKYSRSYPLKRTLQKAQISSQSGPELTPDWQHFTNPVIRLVLDVKTTTDAEIQSVKLRILWELNHGMEIGANQQDVLFEDLELLSFSTLASGVPRKNQTEGLPLKAVYRDTVVGIRYLHSREDSVPVYRRFQISFQVPSQASEFIQMIKPVCPCKLNPTALPPPVSSQMSTLVNRPTIQRKMTSVVPNTSAVPTRGPSFACPPSSALPIALQIQSMSRYTTPQPLPNQSIPYSSPLALHASSDRMSFQVVDTCNSDHRHSAQSTPMQSIIPSGPVPQDLTTPVVQASNTNMAPNIANLPSSSLPLLATPSSSNSATNGSFPAPTNVFERAIGREIVRTLLDDQTSIYNLPNLVLERLISEIIHEDGFVQLVERMSDMLTTRTILGP